jgi:hypothetical protein
MDDGDVSQPHIKLRGNRAYFCKWATHPNIVAHKEFFHVIAPEGVQSFDGINLMEAAGCMMRLALWPTELLWRYVSESLETHMGQDSTNMRSKLQVGAHFRCGDVSYIRRQDNVCVHDTHTKAHEESSYMTGGNPVQIGQCVANLVANYSENFMETRLSDNLVVRSQRLLYSRSSKIFNNLRRRELLLPIQRSLKSKSVEDIMLYIASDNAGSAQQINATAKVPLTVVSPNGCHVEMDPSFDCSKLTIGYWLILATSDVIVTQTDFKGSPISAFSRYAAVYGLKGDSLRDAKDCANVKPLYSIGRAWTGNWFCD